MSVLQARGLDANFTDAALADLKFSVERTLEAAAVVIPADLSFAGDGEEPQGPLAVEIQGWRNAPMHRSCLPMAVSVKLFSGLDVCFLVLWGRAQPRSRLALACSFSLQPAVRYLPFLFVLHSHEALHNLRLE
eukprot:TRINITY_DN27020_c0_g2_i1.p2 TRINITY_DN27020_c0_g2~~TRINITY_DN27020_c0_g2_i1.p2  ORF type:complete len:133 (+),score=11.64 TRINITY_DN27020_c0_g2_i1:80-478(+)